MKNQVCNDQFLHYLLSYIYFSSLLSIVNNRKEKNSKKVKTKNKITRNRDLNVIKGHIYSLTHLLTHSLTHLLIHLGGMPWSEFLSLPEETVDPSLTEPFPFENLDLRRCPDQITNAIKAPMISVADYKWCQWAVSPTGGYSLSHLLTHSRTYSLTYLLTCLLR